MWILRLIVAAAAFLATPATALESSWDATPEARARLVSGVTATGVPTAAPLGLEIALEKGWKTYWRAPGPQGYPPRLIWDGSENVESASIVWPAPKRFSVLGYDSVGYAGGVLLPLNVVFKDPGAPAKLNLEVDYLTCEEICIPQQASLQLDLPGGAATPTKHAFAIDRARGQAPSPPGAGDTVTRVWLDGPDDQPSLVLEGESAMPVTAGDVFVDGLGGYFFRAPKIEMLDDGKFRMRAVAVVAPENPARAGDEAIFTVALPHKTIDQKLALSPPVAMPASSSGGGAPGLLLMLGVAFLGGLILNVMPCVLPVLAIKLMGALKHAEAGRGAVRRGFAASAAGIIVSFMALAAGAIALKSAGTAVGWGMQFQQPLFVAGMAMVMALFAANLWGLFEFGTPEAANRLNEAVPSRPDGVGGAFWSGVLATALATPCSAPFVGSALSFALTRGAGEIAAIFFAMGLGLAAPYLLTAAFPSLARALPKPGAWMNVVRRIMGVAVALTGVWLLWVLWRQAGEASAVVAVVASVGLVLAAAILTAPRRWLAAAGAALLGLAAVGAVASAPNDASSIDWARFDENEIASRVQAGEVILVDVTADWCVTCQWNKATVLSRDPVAALLDGDVMPMQADWTRPDPEIGAYLAKFERFGIPFNVVYGPGAPDGLPLPELLSADGVVEAIEQARGPAR